MRKSPLSSRLSYRGAISALAGAYLIIGAMPLSLASGSAVEED